jgi:hypothetical protein
MESLRDSSGRMSRWDYLRRKVKSYKNDKKRRRRFINAGRGNRKSLRTPEVFHDYYNLWYLWNRSTVKYL